MNKAALAVPAIFALLGIYIIAISLGSGEHVTLIPGHEIPTRFGYLLGGLGIVGGLAIGAEMFGKMRKASMSPVRRVE